MTPTAQNNTLSLIIGIIGIVIIAVLIWLAWPSAPSVDINFSPQAPADTTSQIQQQVDSIVIPDIEADFQSIDSDLQQL